VALNNVLHYAFYIAVRKLLKHLQEKALNVTATPPKKLCTIFQRQYLETAVAQLRVQTAAQVFQICNTIQTEQLDLRHRK
jgi:hypothetical protein